MSSNTTLSSLLLDHPTHQELLGTWKTNGEAWSGPLSPEAYLRRESHLCQQTLTREGGLTFWVLVDPVPAASSKPRRILASCETLRKKAWVTYPTDEEKSSVTEVICHSVGSVFTPPPLRGHGYAGCMIDQLGKALSTWQASDSPVREHQVPVAASVLFSDIGKNFYAARGWHPFPSSHSNLPAVDGLSVVHVSRLPPSKPLCSSDLDTLCTYDAQLIRDTLTRQPSRRKIRLAMLPDVATMRWHHAREDFVANELFAKTPEIKGAIVGHTAGQRAWCVWTRRWANRKGSQHPENILYILRLVIDSKTPEYALENDPSVHTSSSTSEHSPEVLQVAALLMHARKEAAEWHTNSVQLWNPSPLIVRAANLCLELDAEAIGKTPARLEMVDRESDNIASLRWYGCSNTGTPPDTSTWRDVEWVVNEKFGWC